MKKIIFLICLMAGIQRTFAQGTPAYIMDSSQGMFGTGMVGIFSIFSKMGNNFLQAIYSKKNFPTMPAQGVITDVFLINGLPTPIGSTIPELKIRLGIGHYISIKYNPSNPIVWDSTLRAIDTTLTTVLYDSLYTLKTYLGYMTWWRLPLQNPFVYSMIPLNNATPLNLVVQFSCKGEDVPPNSFFSPVGYRKDKIEDTVFTLVVTKMNYPYVPYKFWQATVGYNMGLFIGFNGYSLSVNDPNKLKPFTVFPNPAQSTLHYSEQPSGRFMVYDISGKTVLQGNTDSNGEIHIKTLSSGAYLLKIGEQTIRFLKE